MSDSRPSTMKKYININTKFRPFVKGKQAKNTDFIVTLPVSIKNVLSMKLKSFSAPNSEYTFSTDEKNNSFEVIVGNQTQTVKVIPGIYSTLDNKLLFDQINSQLSNIGISITYIPELLKYAFTGKNISNVEINFDVENNYIYNTFGWIMGFHHSYYSKDPKYATNYPNNKCPVNNGLIAGLTTIGNQEYYLADQPVFLPNTTPYYLLYVDDFLSNVENVFYEGCFPSNNGMKNVLAKVSTKHSTDSQTFYETDTDESFQRVYSGPVTLNKLHIRLFNNNDQIVDFNNANYTFLLELVCKI